MDRGLRTREDQTLETIAEWLAPAATMIAAMMTAANLGARLTGWGFVVFTVGSICWVMVGMSTGQVSLIASNVFLTLTNVVGIWRWLGRQRVYEDGGKTAQLASRHAQTPDLFSATGIAGLPVEDDHGQPIGKVVEALLECESHKVSYVVVASGGVGGIAETLRGVPRALVRFGPDRITLALSQHQFLALPMLQDDKWPSAVAMPQERAA